MEDTYEVLLKDLGARLKLMRKERGWTYRSMVADHKFHISHWQGFENGKGISLRSLVTVCEVFEITLEELFRGLGRSAVSTLTSERKAKTSAKTPMKRNGGSS